MAWNGVVVVDKPGGVTSAEVLRTLKRRLRGVRVGHTGTLDPLATGVLPVCLGEATKLVNHMVLEPKTYRGRIQLGLETDTWDITGTVTARREVPDVREEALHTAFAEQEGERLLAPPVYSAIKHKGKPLYAYARAGAPVQPAARKTRVAEFRLLATEGSVLGFEITCGRGTYVRAVVHALGERLGCGACLLALRRMRCGRFRIAEARTEEEIGAAIDTRTFGEFLRSPAEVVDHLDAFVADHEEEVRIRNGNRLPLPPERGIAGPEGRRVRVLRDASLIAVAEIRREGTNAFLQPVRVLHE